MDEQRIHELAIAYAQVKLQHYQAEYKKTCDEKELLEYARAYKFALLNFEQNFDSLED